jgi:hypothetical protein
MLTFTPQAIKRIGELLSDKPRLAQVPGPARPGPPALCCRSL